MRQCLLLCCGLTLWVGCTGKPPGDATSAVASSEAPPASATEDAPAQTENSPPVSTSATGVPNTGGTTSSPREGDSHVATLESNETEVISFDDLVIGIPVDAKFREFMLDYNEGRTRELFGRRVNVAGYMSGTDSLKGIKEFILLRNLECKFGPGGQADHLVHVLLQGDVVAEFTDQVVYVEGTLRLNPFPDEGPSTWSIYDLDATKVSTTPPPRRR